MQVPEKTPGHLVMLSSHIGNDADYPARSLLTLKTAELLVFEEDRNARNALKAAGVQREYLKYSEHEQKETCEHVLHALRMGKTVAYMSDQGSPTLCDPGRKMLELAYYCRAKVTVVPGPSSLVAAISACPFELDSFFFAGFLPQKREDRERYLPLLSQRKEAIILMEAPYRSAALLAALATAFPKKRRGFLAKDISGPTERYHLGSLSELADLARKEKDKDNFVLIIEKS